MTRVVLDTNFLISAFWTTDGNAARILKMFIHDKLQLIYSYEILAEYKVVLNRPKFHFERVKIGELVNKIRNSGVLADPKTSDIAFADESDRKFYDLAKTHGAELITGNLKHYPKEPFIKTPSEFIGWNV
jgi:putative PIN family toxin of toxin-antitoxin system